MNRKRRLQSFPAMARDEGQKAGAFAYAYGLPQFRCMLTSHALRRYLRANHSDLRSLREIEIGCRPGASGEHREFQKAKNQ